jgi:hypothetical protein
MSRPHGNISGHHSNASSIHASITFTNARQSLVQTLENLSFVKVVTIQNSSAGYTGEAVEVHFRDARDKPKLVFFDKFGRSRSSLTIGPIKVSQAPLGLDHPSAIPTVGEILVGSLVPNARKSHLDHVLRGWSSDATPLKELLRLLKFGTKHSEFEVRQILLQPAALLSRSPISIKKSRDDIYMTARIILWSSLRPLQILASIEEKWPLKSKASPEDIEMATNIKISCKAVEFIEALVIKFNDSKLSEDFFKDLEVPEVPEVVEATMPSARHIVLVCLESRVRFYTRLGWNRVETPVRFDQPDGPQLMEITTMARPVGLSAWPTGDVDLCGLPW